MMITKQALEFALAKGMILNPYATMDEFWDDILEAPSLWADRIAILEYIQDNEQFPDPKREAPPSYPTCLGGSSLCL